MSLINDALKRATQAQPSNTPAPEPETPMQPVEPRGPVGVPVYFFPMLLFILGGACWFLVKGWEARRQSGLYPQPVTVQARELLKMAPKDEPAPAAPANRRFALGEAPTLSAEPEASPKETTTATATAAAAPAAAVVTEDTPKVTPFKLQAIFYRPANPSAVVNAKTVFVGDVIGNGKVKAISRQSVTIDLGGEIKVLTFQ